MISVSDGYVVLANISYAELDSVGTVAFKTDFNGNLIDGFHYIEGGTGKTIRQLQNGGYIVVGDYIKSDLTVEGEAANTVIASAYIAFLGADLELIPGSSFYIYDPNPDSFILTDYYGGTASVSDNGDVFILGTYVEPIGSQLNVPHKPFILALNPDLSFNWSTNYDLINRNYQNSKSLHIMPNNNLIWASSITRELAGSKFEASA
jgi:hypothetical protein